MLGVVDLVERAHERILLLVEAQQQHALAVQLGAHGILDAGAVGFGQRGVRVAHGARGGRVDAAEFVERAFDAHVGVAHLHHQRLALLARPGVVLRLGQAAQALEQGLRELAAEGARLGAPLDQAQAGVHLRRGAAQARDFEQRAVERERDFRELRRELRVGGGDGAHRGRLVGILLLGLRGRGARLDRVLGPALLEHGQDAPVRVARAIERLPRDVAAQFAQALINRLLRELRLGVFEFGLQRRDAGARQLAARIGQRARLARGRRGGEILAQQFQRGARLLLSAAQARRGGRAILGGAFEVVEFAPRVDRCIARGGFALLEVGGGELRQRGVARRRHVLLREFERALHAAHFGRRLRGGAFGRGGVDAQRRRSVEFRDRLPIGLDDAAPRRFVQVAARLDRGDAVAQAVGRRRRRRRGRGLCASGGAARQQCRQGESHGDDREEHRGAAGGAEANHRMAAMRRGGADGAKCSRDRLR